jgi:hypothetical protein
LKLALFKRFLTLIKEFSFFYINKIFNRGIKMKKKINFVPSLLLLVILSFPTFSQGPGEPYNPMSANGAKGISQMKHTLFWANPNNVIYNKVYFSEDSVLVSNSDNSSLIYDGYPTTVFYSVSLAVSGFLGFFKDYYWKVVEFDAVDSTNGDVWKFKTRENPIWMTWVEDDFENGANNWNITNDGGSSWCIWSIHNAIEYLLPQTASGNVLAADVDDCGSGSTLLSTATLRNEIDVSGYNLVTIEFDNDWNVSDAQDEAHVEISTNGGNSWIGVWDQVGIDIRNTHEVVEFNISPQIAISTILLRFRSVQPGWDWWWAIDNLKIETYGLLTPPEPPILLTAYADSAELLVSLNWTPGWCVTQTPVGYEIIRKNGLPTDTTSYILLTTINENVLSFDDDDIQSNQTYTYRIRSLCDGASSIWGNEATAYVPNIVPVELQSFTAEINGSNVNIIWSTATETNNQGFEIQKQVDNRQSAVGNWRSIGFVPGFGTTTEMHHYSYTDESLQSGNYQYRLKQIDFDGSFEYSNILEVTIDAPTEFTLEQNYPNPFNPSTKIKYSIPSVTLRQAQSDIPVTLIVYDVLGNEVATLVNEEKPAGTYEVEFNVAQVSRPELASGIYFYQLKAGNFLEIKKMILLK